MATCPHANILDSEFFVHGNHYENLAKIRNEGGGVVKIDDPLTGVPYWAIMRREEADYICKHPELFSSEAKSAIPQELDEENLERQRQMMVNMDPPKHQKYRRIARNAFTPKAVETYEPKFRQYAREIIDTVASKGKCEFVSDVAAELPLMAILELCGVPKEDRHKFFDWTNAMFFREDDDMSEGDDPEAAALEASTHVFFYAQQLAQQHAVKPLNNIVGALLDGEVEDEKLTEMEFQMFFLMLIAAGNESTRSVTSHGMRLLMENPDQYQLLKDNPDMIPHAVEEMLRYNAAFTGMRREVMEDIELSGQQLKKGDKMYLCWHSINQDENVFDNPLDFDVTRFKRMPDLYNQHRAFGVGQHFCLGSHLARLELKVMFEELIPRINNPKFDGPVQYVRDFFVNGIKTMPITFDPE